MVSKKQCQLKDYFSKGSYYIANGSMLKDNICGQKFCCVALKNIPHYPAGIHEAVKKSSALQSFHSKFITCPQKDAESQRGTYSGL